MKLIKNIHLEGNKFKNNQIKARNMIFHGYEKSDSGPKNFKLVPLKFLISHVTDMFFRHKTSVTPNSEKHFIVSKN
jgi:hypothetical protein